MQISENTPPGSLVPSSNCSNVRRAQKYSFVIQIAFNAVKSSAGTQKMASVLLKDFKMNRCSSRAARPPIAQQKLVHYKLSPIRNISLRLSRNWWSKFKFKFRPSINANVSAAPSQQEERPAQQLNSFAISTCEGSEFELQAWKDLTLHFKFNEQPRHSVEDSKILCRRLRTTPQNEIWIFHTHQREQEGEKKESFVIEVF